MYLYFHYLRLLVRSFFRLILISLLHLYVFIKIIITFYIDSDCIRYTTYMYSYLVVWIMNLWQGVIIGYKSTHKLSPDNLRLYLTLYSRSIGYIAGCTKHERVFVVPLISMVIKLILGFYYLYLDHVSDFFLIWYSIWYSFIYSMLSYMNNSFKSWTLGISLHLTNVFQRYDVIFHNATKYIWRQ